MDSLSEVDLAFSESLSGLESGVPDGYLEVIISVRRALVSRSDPANFSKYSFNFSLSRSLLTNLNSFLFFEANFCFIGYFFASPGTFTFGSCFWLLAATDGCFMTL